MIKNKFYKNIKETVKKWRPFKSKNNEYREHPKDVDAERHPEEQIYPDLFQQSADFKNHVRVIYTQIN